MRASFARKVRTDSRSLRYVIFGALSVYTEKIPMVYTVTIARVYTERRQIVYTAPAACRGLGRFRVHGLEYGEGEAKWAAIALAGAETENGISGCGGSTPLPENADLPPLWGG